MRQITPAALCFITLALLVTALPLSAQTAELATKPALVDSSPSYLLHSERLGFPSGMVAVRFEYRLEDKVLASDKVQLRFGGADTLLVPIPDTFHKLAVDTDVRMMIFVGDLLLEVFDHDTLAAYNRVLGYTHLDARPALDTGGYTKIDCGSPCYGGCGPYDDYDCDGVNNITDNCTDDPNSNQADCDSDGWGDVCDGQNATYQASGSVDTCMTDKDNHIGYFTFEHHVEQRQVDVSSCGAPDQWNRWVREDNDCVAISDYDCCWGLRFSLSAVGDSYTVWCASGTRNVDYCH